MLRGRIIELRGVAKSVSLSSEWFNLVEPYSAELDKTPVVSLELPVTLEEHTARMAENLALLDMTWSVLIEAARPFAKAANQVRASPPKSLSLDPLILTKMVKSS